MRVGPRMMLYIQHVGEIKVKSHRPLPNDAGIKHVVIKHRNRTWSVCLMLDLPDPVVDEHPGPAVGIDMGLYSLLALTDGIAVENPRRCARRWQNCARSRDGCGRSSVRRRKAAVQVAEFHERIANQRRDFWHKTALDW